MHVLVLGSSCKLYVWFCISVSFCFSLLLTSMCQWNFVLEFDFLFFYLVTFSFFWLKLSHVRLPCCRFGTGPASQGSDSLKNSEELKRKARAERSCSVSHSGFIAWSWTLAYLYFSLLCLLIMLMVSVFCFFRFGLPVASTATEEEAKKKARLERFAPASKVDAVEEDKRKARAARSVSL